MARYLVVGAGAVGSAVARLVAERGDEAVVVSRRGGGPQAPGVRRVAGRRHGRAADGRAGDGRRAVLDAANPAYHRWHLDWPPLAASLLTAAERSGAVLVTVGNLYGYGPVDVPMTEDLPFAARTVKGAVRAQMWRDALAAHQAGRVRAVEVRGSDYRALVDQSMLGDRVMRPLLAGRAVRVVGDLDQPHTLDRGRRRGSSGRRPSPTTRAPWGRAWHVPSCPLRARPRAAVADLAAEADEPRGRRPFRDLALPPRRSWSRPCGPCGR